MRYEPVQDETLPGEVGRYLGGGVEEETDQRQEFPRVQLCGGEGYPDLH